MQPGEHHERSIVKEGGGGEGGERRANKYSVEPHSAFGGKSRMLTTANILILLITI
jgi:hypothetical protein